MAQGRSCRIWDTQGWEKSSGRGTGMGQKNIFTVPWRVCSLLVKANYSYFCGGDTNLDCFFPWKRQQKPTYTLPDCPIPLRLQKNKVLGFSLPTPAPTPPPSASCPWEPWPRPTFLNVRSVSVQEHDSQSIFLCLWFPTRLYLFQSQYFHEDGTVTVVKIPFYCIYQHYFLKSIVTDSESRTLGGTRIFLLVT